MSKQTKKLTQLNQSGLVHLLYPLLGLIVVALIAGAGFYVYQQNLSGAGSSGSSFSSHPSGLTAKFTTVRVKQKNQPNKSAACNPYGLAVSVELRGGVVAIRDEGGKLLGPCKQTSGGYTSTFEYKLNITNQKLGKYRYVVHNLHDTELAVRSIKSSNKDYMTLPHPAFTTAYPDVGHCAVFSPSYTGHRVPSKTINVTLVNVDQKDGVVNC